MKKYSLITLLLMIKIVMGANPITLFVDYLSFASTPDLNSTEITLAIPAKQLTYNDSLRASFSVKTTVSKDSVIVAEDYFGQYFQLKSILEKEGDIEIPVKTTLNLKPGAYGLTIVVKDLISNDSTLFKIPQAENKFIVQDYGNKAAISQIQLCSKLLADDQTDSEFAKSGLILIPNPRRIYGTHNPFLSYYAELYNLAQDQSYNLKWQILNAQNKVSLSSSEDRVINSKGSTLAIFDKLKIYNLKSGTYFLEFKLHNTQTKDSISNKTHFYIYRPLDFSAEKVKNADLADIFDLMEKEEIEQEYSQLKIVLSGKDQSLILNLNDDGKRNWLSRYWQEKEAKEPNARQNFLNLIKLAELKYGTVNNKGWEVDRGRILVKMGKEPDNIETNIFQNGLADHEIWHYYDNNIKHVFVDWQNMNQFKLLHSDLPGEKKDPDWKTTLTKSGQSKNSKHDPRKGNLNLD